jgi:predicted enzyme related to lactoylglutathione lyase
LLIVFMSRVGGDDIRAKRAAPVDNRRIGEHPVFRPGGISYLRISARDPQASADFYEGVFGWNVRRDSDEPAFEDGTGHVIGHFMSSETEVRPYVFVERLSDALEKIETSGGEVVTPPYPEGDLTVATFRDPAGNEIGVWQLGPMNS